MRAQAPKGDLIFIALLNHKIVAALRLHPVGLNSGQNCYLLRSMCVAAELRQQRIGSKLLQHIQTDLEKIQCYSFPFEHLVAFYQGANFILCDAGTVPEAIADKFQRYINNGKKIKLMKHQPQSALTK